MNRFAPSATGRLTLRAAPFALLFAAVGCSVAYDATLAANEGQRAGAGGIGGGAGIGGAAGSGTAGGSAGRGGVASQGGTAGQPAAGAAGLGGDATGGSGGGVAGTTGGPPTTKCPGGTDNECNDGNPCTVERCVEGICTSAPFLPGTACDTDSDRCNGVGICDGAACKIDPKTAVDPFDTDKCTDDLCDPATGIVTHPPKVKASDSTVCTLVLCDPTTGEKLTKDRADDGDACTFDECSLDTGALNTPKPIGDGDPCTKDSCDKITGIRHEKDPACLGCTADLDCADDNPCTSDKCGAGKLCVHEVLDGTSCDNGTVCDGIGVCKKGVCDKGTPVQIDDGNPCTVDACDPITGAKHTPIDVDDDNACTADACDPTAPPPDAVSHVFLSLQDGDPCTVDSCFPATGIIHVPIPSCKRCTTVADCPAGKCLSSLCNPTAEGSVCSTGNLQAGSSCSDGQACNGSEACDGQGNCASGQPPLLDDGNACTTDGCIEPSGPFHTPTASCKACVTVADCDVPSNVCFVRDCVGGKCTTKPAPTGTSCSNGQKCDGSETCEAGVCKTGPIPSCGVPMCQGTQFVAPTCSQSNPAANGCGTITQDCAATNKVCSVASNGCVGCDNTSNLCEGGRVCDVRGAAPHACCTPTSQAVACGSRVCGTVVNNCGQTVSCGTCTTAPNLTCSAQGSCSCTPQSNATTCGSRVCGTVLNNCNTAISCGTCAGIGTSCSASGQCVACVAQSQAVTCGAKICGQATNNCGQSVSCGVCPVPSTCSGDGLTCL